MDASTAVAVALISAISGLISGIVVAYAKPLAEDRALALREQRQERRRNLDRMWDALIDPRNSTRALPTVAAAIGDDNLIGHVELFLAADSDEQREAALGDARRRLGQLMRG